MFMHFSILHFSLINWANGPVWEFSVGFYLLRFPSESLMVFFTSSFPGLKNLSFSEPNPLKGIFSFFFSKSLMLTSIHFCCHISRCQTQESPPVPSVTSAITTSCSRKERGRKRKKKRKNNLPKPVSQSGWALEALRDSGMHLQQLCCASVQGRVPVPGRLVPWLQWMSWGCCWGWCPQAGHSCQCQLHGQTSGWLAGAHPPPSLPPPPLQIPCKVVL